MMILITCILLVLLLISINCVWDDIICSIIGFFFVICIIITLFFVESVVGGRTIIPKIEMYTEENQRIEDNINILVKQYMDYESNTYIDLKNESGMNLISLYPELKSDTLVGKQIEIYTYNNEKIKELKEKLIDIRNCKWWLYFGS